MQPLVSSEEADPFADIDEGTEDADSSSNIMDTELSDLISQLQGSEDACSASDLVSAEEALPVCSEFTDETWDEEFLAELGPRDKSPCPDEQSENEGEDEDEPELKPAPALPHLKSFREAMTYLEDVHIFLEYRGYTPEATAAHSYRQFGTTLHISCINADQYY